MRFFLNYKNLFISALIFFVLRIFIVLIFDFDYNSVEDFAIAENIVAGHGYTVYAPVGPTAIKVPLYPLLLSVFVFIFGSSAKLSIVIIQHLLISSIPLLIVKLGMETKYIKQGYIAAWMFLLHPSYFYYPNVIEATNIFIFLALLYLLAFVKVMKCHDTKAFSLLALLSGILWLTQPIVLPFVFISWLFLFNTENLKKFLLSTVIVTAIISPWIIRNYVVYDKFIPTKSPFWMNFYVGYLPDYHNNEKYDVIESDAKEKIDSLINAYVNDVDLELYYKDAVVDAINDKPEIYIEKSFYQMISFWWVPQRYIDDNRITFLLVRKIPVIILNLLTLIGLYYLFKENKYIFWSLFLVLVYFTFIYGLTQNANVRFKLDIEWLQLLAIGFIKKPLTKQDSGFSSEI